jgi:hypothetical protein
MNTRILNPLQPTTCEKHGCVLVRKRVFQPAQTIGIGDPGPAELMVGRELPHYLPRFYSDVPDLYHTEAVEVFVCEACQSHYPETLALVAKHLAEREREPETDVAGFFQLSALSEFPHLKKIVPGLSDRPSVEIIQRLQTDGLRWRVGTIKKRQAERYQFEAGKYGLKFIIASSEPK